MKTVLFTIVVSIVLFQEFIWCLRLTEVRIPNHTARDKSARLECHYELDNETLYSVKWYKDGNEFYRYVPRDMPPAQVFPLPGVSVDLHNSTDSVVVLENVNLSTTGRFRCEVSGEAPSFQTVSDHGDMIIVAMADECSNADGDNETNIRRGLDVIQSMIDISADRLEGLRTQCATSAELTQQEIRSLERKLVKMFSELLVTKAKLPERLPKGLPVNGAELKQWLRVVGLSPESLNVVVQRINTLETLLEKSDTELRVLLQHNAKVREEEVRRLVTAMLNLKRCRISTAAGVKEPDDLYWGSWDRHHHIHHRSGASPRPNRAVNSTLKQSKQPLPSSNRWAPISGEQIHSPIEFSPPPHTGSTVVQHHLVQTISPDEPSVTVLSPTPPSSPTFASIKSAKGGFPTTPPPKKKHQLTASSIVAATTTTANTTSNSSCTATTQHTVTTSVPASSIITMSSTTHDQSGSGTLTKSKSHESQLLAAAAAAAADQMAANITNHNQATIITTHAPTPRSRLHTEPSPEHYNDLIMENSNNLVVPRSPCTPVGVVQHQRNAIAVGRPAGYTATGHRFTKKFKMSTCDLCNKQLFFGLKCKECKYRCHKDCESQVPPECIKPPPSLSDVFLPTGSNNSANMMTRHPMGTYLLGHHRERLRSHDYNAIAMYPHGLSANTVNAATAVESSSPCSSCHSSTPSSPALLQFQHQHYQQQQQHHHHHHHHNQQQSQQLPTQSHTPVAIMAAKTQFKFPEVSNHIYKPDTVGGITLETHLIRQEKLVHQLQQPPSPRPHHEPTTTNAVAHAATGGGSTAATILLNDSEKTISLSASTDSDRTPIRIDSTDEPDEGDDRLGGDTDTDRWTRQNSVCLKEWDIPFEDIILMEKIGDGRFGTVHRAQWHGAVAIKILKEDYLDNEAFKLEVATFKKTRHENVVLFMGACISPQAIVTSLCKGNTLYTHIHLRKDKFNLNKTTMVAQQISLGMGYLHARSITHKDLKTKNIFLENGKVIITDFGLFSATKLDYSESQGLCIPHGWLAYLAPEIMQKLTPYRPEHRDQLPFSTKSDIYAFGTVWYELLCGEFPFKSQAPEAVIFQVGRGIKQTLANLQAARDVKEILMTCWAFDYNLRPDFSTILQQLEKLPKKRLARSPSHPVQLSRSAESVF